MEEKKKYNKVADALKDDNFIEATQMMTDIFDDNRTKDQALKKVQTMSSVTKQPIMLNSLEAILYNQPERFIKEDGTLKKGADTFIYTLVSLGEIDVNSRFNDNENILLRYASVGSPDLFNVILNTENVDIKETDSAGHNALTYAVWNNNTAMIEYLVKDKGFDVNEENFFSDSKTPLHWACLQLENASVETFEKYKQTIEKLIELGADLTKQDSTEDMSLPVELVPSYEEEDITDEVGAQFSVLCDNLFETLKEKTKQAQKEKEENIEESVGLSLNF